MKSSRLCKWLADQLREIRNVVFYLKKTSSSPAYSIIITRLTLKLHKTWLIEIALKIQFLFLVLFRNLSIISRLMINIWLIAELYFPERWMIQQTKILEIIYNWDVTHFGIILRTLYTGMDVTLSDSRVFSLIWETSKVTFFSWNHFSHLFTHFADSRSK